MSTTAKNTMAKDALLYLPAKVLEGIIGILAIKLYTMYFVPDIYGYYSIINTSVNIFSLLSMGWLIQSCFRYVNSFNSTRKLRLFYSTAFTAWSLVNGIILIAGVLFLIIWSGFAEKWTVQLVLSALIMFITFNTAQILFGLLGATRRIKLNLSLSVFSASAKLIFTVVFVNLLKSNHITPIAAVISNILVDALVIAIIFIRLQLYKFISYKLFSGKVFKKLLHYGVPIMGVALTMSLLNLSDRYVIIFSLGKELGPSQAGVYSANYSIASSIFTMINFAVMRGVYPTLLKNWRKDHTEQTEQLLSQGVRYYLLIAFPAAVGLSILSSFIAALFIDPAYYEGRFVIAWVAFGMMFLGLTEYSNKAWELTSRTKSVFKNSLISGAFNVIANLIFIPLFGYYVAAITTALSYLLYLALSLTGSRKILKWRLPLKTYLRMLISNLLMGLVLLSLLFFNKPSPVIALLAVVLGGAVYAACLYFTGEISTEVKQAFALLHKRKTSK